MDSLNLVESFAEFAKQKGIDRPTMMRILEDTFRTMIKKRFESDGNFYFEKHKIFLYKEDFEKFIDGLQEVVSYIEQNQVEEYDSANPSEYEKVNSNQINGLELAGVGKNYVNVDFDDLSH